MDPRAKTNVDNWLEGPYDDETKKTIQKMLKKDPQEVEDAFYSHLTFGTGGLRGLMGVGTNRMNRYTVQAATQGLANYLLTLPPLKEGHSVFIGFDSRHHSREFAEETAKVLAGNGIRVHLYKELRPSPMVSFGCRFKKCSAAIMITASHNPPEYNGYKVYWNDGAQILPPHDALIIAEVQKITSPRQVKSVGSINHPLIHKVGEDIDAFYFEAIKPLLTNPVDDKREGSQLKIVYTSLHGAGITAVPKALQQAGFTNFVFVVKQVIPEGDFPTVKNPNPEEKAAMKMGIDRMQQTQAHILIATDPDADRIGVGVRHKGEVRLLNGNQTACILLYHILTTLKSQNRLPEKAAFIKTIATTELFKTICNAFGVACFDVLTGFKYFAEKIRVWEQMPHGFHYVFGGEESCGYLLGTQTREKDAITASVLVAEVALQAKTRSKTLIDLLHEIYKKYGFYYEKLVSVQFSETKEGKEKMAAGMSRLQSNPPQQILGIAVESIEDYSRSLRTHLKTGKTEPLTLPQSNVLLFWLEDGTKLMIRPSGTEPKIKLYCGVVQKQIRTIEEAEIESEKRATDFLQALHKELIT